MIDNRSRDLVEHLLVIIQTEYFIYELMHNAAARRGILQAAV
jgi:hypothetical protein